MNINLDPDKPAVWTSLGNVNVEHLQKYIEWSRHGDTLKLRIVHMHDGEIVREDAHCQVIEGLASLSEQSALA